MLYIFLRRHGDQEINNNNTLKITRFFGLYYENYKDYQNMMIPQLPMVFFLLQQDFR